MDRYYFERGRNRILIYDRNRGSGCIYKDAYIATVSDIDVAQQIVDLLNKKIDV